MGEVWKAVDTTLDRDVAIKILPASFAREAERLARFEREAKLLASLNHPNIAAVYSVHESEGVHFLAMELVPGEDLAGPLPLTKVLQVAGQVAEALEVAHESGVIHRDIKPANIRMTPEGRVKVLDFGLAKTVQPSPAAIDMSSPTMTAARTEAGVILGTTGYMSPEQARGTPLDRRSDVWSFGCLMYELFTGTQAFVGETMSDTIAKILEREPDWNKLPAEVPSTVRRLLKRCLRKDPTNRLRDMGDIRIEIAEMLGDPEQETGHDHVESAPAKRPSRQLTWILVSAALVGGLLGWMWLSRRVPPAGPLVQFTIELPPELRLLVSYTSPMALSPDGTALAFAIESAGRRQLYVRRLDELEIQRLEGTENGDTPFFSPDGQTLGFAANGKYWRVALNGGDPVPIATAPGGSRGAAWLRQGAIVFDAFAAGLEHVSPGGGKPTTLTTLDRAIGDVGHGWPQVLPGGKRVLFTVATNEGSRAAVLTLDTGHWQVIDDIGDVEGARYLPTGHLLYAQSGRLMALPYDLEQLKALGPHVQVVDSVYTSPDGVAYFAVSESGVLAYAPGGEVTPRRRLVWADREGNVSTLPGEHRDAFEHPRLSPDGTKAAMLVHTDVADHDIYIQEVSIGRQTLLVSDANTVYPVWIENGAYVAFASSAFGSIDIVRRRSDGSGTVEPLLIRKGLQRPNAWSVVDGRLAFYERGDKTGDDIYMLEMDGKTDPVPFVRGPADERIPSISPDGHWLAYVSNETGAEEVYVAEYPSGRKATASMGGGREPVWSRDGRSLFYRNGDKMLEVEIAATSEGVSIGDPRLIFERSFYQDADGHPNYDVAPDGRFLMIERDLSTVPTELRVLVNWFDELERIAPKSVD